MLCKFLSSAIFSLSPISARCSVAISRCKWKVQMGGVSIKLALFVIAKRRVTICPIAGGGVLLAAGRQSIDRLEQILQVNVVVVVVHTVHPMLTDRYHDKCGRHLRITTFADWTFVDQATLADES
uniref:Secreted protein n=1 Tax=Globodera rostochiensis TaxID=31243 RepID=A0A914I3N3_GLORO